MDAEALYRAVIDRWNARDAAGYTALFAPDGTTIGFDGSTAVGRDEIAAHLGEVFADHVTATYVVKVREVRPLGPDAALVRAVAGLVPPGSDDLNPQANAAQSLVAVRGEDGWRIALFQNTPAAYHGRPDLADALTAELRAELEIGDRA